MHDIDVHLHLRLHRGDQPADARDLSPTTDHVARVIHHAGDLNPFLDSLHHLITGHFELLPGLGEAGLQRLAHSHLAFLHQSGPRRIGEAATLRRLLGRHAEQTAFYILLLTWREREVEHALIVHRDQSLSNLVGYYSGEI